MPGLIALPATKTTVTIGGTPVDVPRDVRPLQLRTFARGSYPTFTFAARGPLLEAGDDPYMGQAVVVTVNGTVRFKGRVESCSHQPQWTRTYQCLGLRSDADHVRNIDALSGGGDTSVYNAAPDNDQLAYLAGRAGRTVGQILSDRLREPEVAAALDALGLGAYTSLTPPTLPADTVADLAALTVIPPNAVRFGGEKFGVAIDSFLQQVAPNHVAFWRPSDGALRIFDQRAYTPATLTWGTDPIALSPVSRDVTGCYTRCQALGQRIAEMAAISLIDGGLDETLFAHSGLTSAQAKAAWREADWQRPGMASGQAEATGQVVSGGLGSTIAVKVGGYGYSSAPAVVIVGDGSGATATAAVSGGKVTSVTRTAAGSGYTKLAVVIAAPAASNSDAGTCTCPTATTVTVTSANKATLWGSNFWDQATGRKGTILLYSTVTSGVDAIAQRRIVSNASLSPGGTATLTLDRALPHTNFDRYVLTGETGGAADVYTLYKIVDADIRANLAPQASVAFPYRFAGGSGLTYTSTPIGTVLWYPTSATVPPLQESTTGVVVDRVNGTVRFSRPTKAIAGKEPADIRALVPVWVASNVATVPADSGGLPQYEGKAYTEDGIERTLPITVRGWRDPLNLTAMLAYAQDQLDAVKDPAIEASVIYRGLYEAALEPGVAISLAGDGYPTGWEGLEAPVVSCTIEWNKQGVPIGTVLDLSTRRAAYSAEMFLRPERTGDSSLDFGASLDLSGLAGRVPNAGSAIGRFTAGLVDQAMPGVYVPPMAEGNVLAPDTSGAKAPARKAPKPPEEGPYGGE